MECSICNNEIDKQFAPDGKTYWDGGHNPWPFGLSDKDQCCSRCNDLLVIPARIKLHFKKED